MEVQPTVDQVQNVTVGTERAVVGSAESKNSVGQRCSEPQLNVVAFLSGSLDGDQAAVDEAHRANRFTSFTIKSILTSAVELMLSLVLQVRLATAVVLARSRVTTRELY